MKKFFLPSSVFLATLIFLIGLSLTFVSQALASNPVGGNANNSSSLPVGGNANNSAAATSLYNPLGTSTTVFSLTGRIISVVLGLVGSIALVMFIYGGVLWMTSAGSADRVKKGREAILWAVIGMAVIFASYGLTKFLLDKITGS
ncbi:MAG: pilin [Candidatus Falkowbacteria bacterium]|nr:pilin [Candidatus Falkowbacteria bacterium]